jgi:cellulose synthase/poly-beta-1,6-N-acetylglucosamine synthase-like glycosyltransferase
MTLESVVLAAYFGCLVVLSVYGAHRYHIIRLYRRHRGDVPEPRGRFADAPRVTVQLPVYNELYVVERLIRSVCALRHPRERLEIQVLDDSTDETSDVAARLCAEYRERGFDIRHLRRSDRTGFKAGALREGLATAKGEFLAIFDADFIPAPDTLERTLPHFTDPSVGMVQTRWGHVNRAYSLLTHIQAMYLDGHFVLEHTARNRSGKFFNFNGTAGVWRRACVESAGGWQFDTLTEDLDLSYRAQLAGWRFVFLKDVVSPAEVPVEMTAFKSQQHRWAKGSIQTCKKLLPRIWRAPVPAGVKIEATFHLTANFAYLLVLLMSVLMLPTVVYRAGIESTLVGAAFDLSLMLAATVSVGWFYAFAQREIDSRWHERLWQLPFALALGIGLSINNAKAVVEALLGHESSFKRTPKYAVTATSDVTWARKKYSSLPSLLPFVELAFAGYFAAIVRFAADEGLWFTAAFLLLFVYGYLYVGLLSLFQRRFHGGLFAAGEAEPAGAAGVALPVTVSPSVAAESAAPAAAAR